MLHLFNSCYVYPDILFDPSSNYIIIGKNHSIYGAQIEESFYYNNVTLKTCFGLFATYEDFINSNMVEPAFNHKDKMIIYCDDDTIVKFFTAKIKTHIFNFDQELYFNLCKLFAVRLKIRSKLLEPVISTNIQGLSDRFKNISTVPTTAKFNLDQYWVWENAGIEWKYANRKCGVFNNCNNIISNLINRCVYSHFQEAKACYLSRKEAEGSWATDANNQQFKTVVSMKELYKEMRKELALFTDPLILQFYETGVTEELLTNPKFLLLISSNANMGDKVDTWMIRWFMKMPHKNITELGLIA